MTIELVKKEKGRVYKSAEIVSALFGLELTHDDEGAPKVEGAFISISDTKNYWACSIADHPVGIDMEEFGRAVKPAIAKRFHKEEQEYLAALSEGSREWTDEFFSIWTRKEAWSKLKGKGYQLGFSKFSVLSGQLEGVPVNSFTKNRIYFGIAGDACAEIVFREYDAPMEKSALDYAAGLLDVRAYSEGALSKKLSERGYRPDDIENALKKLRDYGYVNDEAYAENLARRSAEGGKGTLRIKRELKEKGIDAELAQSTAVRYKGGERERALELARKLFEKEQFGEALSAAADELSSEEKKALYARKQKLVGKISRKLSSLGYEPSVIYYVMEDLFR